MGIFGAASAIASAIFVDHGQGGGSGDRSAESLLREELAENPWILFSAPRRQDDTPCYVYKCGNRMIDIPMTDMSKGKRRDSCRQSWNKACSDYKLERHDLTGQRY